VNKLNHLSSFVKVVGAYSFRVSTNKYMRCSSTFLVLSISVSSQCAGSEVKPLTEDRGCDSVLLGQSNRTPQGAVIDEYGAMVE
jgi:hypothetical protein